MICALSRFRETGVSKFENFCPMTSDSVDQCYSGRKFKEIVFELIKEVCEEATFYGAVVWDHWLIVGQIVCLQCLYYITLGMFLSLFVGTQVSRMSLVYFFDYVTITTSTVTGWCVIASFLLSSLAGAVYMLYLIERAKKCLDFSATLYIIHLFICIVYGGWPSSITWWIVNGTGIAVMALLGEYLCIKRELQEIPITRYRSRLQMFDWQK